MSDVTSIARQLLHQMRATLQGDPEPLPGGRNNRVFRLHSDRSKFLLKLYYHAPDDPRDRLHNEYSFLEYLQQAGCMSAPTPYQRDDVAKAAILEFIEGEPVPGEQVGDAEVRQACDFFRQANDPEKRHLASNLPNAAEACFSLEEHLRITQQRIDRLAQMDNKCPLEQAAIEYVRTDLIPLWQRVRERIEDSGLALNTTLPQAERVLSPSDFGFHNSLREDSGCLRFVDFEYAGWDDPAKLISDFQNQPDLLLVPELARKMAETVIEANPQPEALRARLSLLEPLYQLKWACICLNPFLQSGKQRLAFQQNENALQRIQEQQLEKARVMSQRAEELSSHTIR